MGMDMILPEQGIEILAQALGQPSARVAVLPIKWHESIQQFTINGNPPPLLSELVDEKQPGARDKQTSLRQSEILQRLETSPAGKRRGLLFSHIQDQVIKVLQLDPSQPPDPRKGLFDMGMDSLMSLELKNSLENSLGLSLPAVLTFNYSNIEDLTDHLAEQMLSLESPTNSKPAQQENTVTRARFLEEIENLSEKEVEALINEELEALKGGE
jgi:acyl carrier protein